MLADSGRYAGVARHQLAAQNHALRPIRVHPREHGAVDLVHGRVLAGPVAAYHLRLVHGRVPTAGHPGFGVRLGIVGAVVGEVGFHQAGRPAQGHIQRGHRAGHVLVARQVDFYGLVSPLLLLVPGHLLAGHDVVGLLVVLVRPVNGAAERPGHARHAGAVEVHRGASFRLLMLNVVEHGRVEVGIHFRPIREGRQAGAERLHIKVQPTPLQTSSWRGTAGAYLAGTRGQLVRP